MSFSVTFKQPSEPAKNYHQACALLTKHILRAKNELLALIAENRSDK